MVDLDVVEAASSSVKLNCMSIRRGSGSRSGSASSVVIAVPMLERRFQGLENRWLRRFGSGGDEMPEL